MGAADAYRELRRAQHRARLDERPTHFELGDAGTQPEHGGAGVEPALARAREAILRLWQHVFG
jgi:glutamate-ammonia-ligase adenylyltransferase